MEEERDRKEKETRKQRELEIVKLTLAQEKEVKKLIGFNSI